MLGIISFTLDSYFYFIIILIAPIFKSLFWYRYFKKESKARWAFSTFGLDLNKFMYTINPNLQSENS